MTSGVTQRNFWRRRRSVPVYFLILGGAQTRSYQSPRQAPAMVTLRTGFGSCLHWLLFSLPKTLSASLPPKSRQVCKKHTAHDERLNPGKTRPAASAWRRRDGQPAPPPGLLVLKSPCALRLSLLHNKPRWQPQTQAAGLCLNPTAGLWLDRITWKSNSGLLEKFGAVELIGKKFRSHFYLS